MFSMIRVSVSLLFGALTAGVSVAEPAFIPMPSEVVFKDGVTDLGGFRIEAGKGLEFEGRYLGEKLAGWKKQSGYESSGAGVLTMEVGRPGGGFDYELVVEGDSIRLVGKDKASVFYGVQTLLQMVTLEGRGKADFNIRLGVVRDSARYGWRGLMLDSSRHFQTVDEVKEFIDVMVEYKYNVFHWHLTDDQGWRIEIKSRPKLTTLGSKRVRREGIWWTRPGPLKGEEANDGGFYTQEQIRDVVRYAAERHVEVIPEIDVPGHALAILTAYPELSTTGGPFQVNPGSVFYNIIENTLDPSNPETYEFMDDVLKEVAGLFPSVYVHIGGDEATRKFWNADADCKVFMEKHGIGDTNELQSYFIKRMEKNLAKYGKRLIGWDEILDGGLAESATVMSWRGDKYGDEALKLGKQVVIAANSAYYFDLYQGHAEYEPATYGKLRLRATYAYEYRLPEGVDSKLLLGLHGALWTEEVPNQRHAQYMLWPRGFALAESAWSTNAKKDWPGFVRRVEGHFKRFDFMDINYAKSMYDPMISMSKKGKREVITLSTEVDGLAIHYTFDEGEVDVHYPVYKEPLVVPLGATTIRMRTYRDGEAVGKLRTAVIANINKPKKLLFPTAVGE